MENSDNETRHNTNAVVSEQDLADTYFPAFMSCANRGKASGVMCSYNAVNGSSALLRMSPHFSSCAAEPSWIAGVPSCASKELLNDNMRSKWGFNGYITSDCGAVGNVANAEPSGHGFTHDDSNLTAKTTLEAGMDNDCGELASGLHSSQDASDIVVDRPVLRRGQWHSSRSPELGLRPEGELDAAAQEPLPRANGFAKR